jgi:O-antigen/teichoic acid export membrane protein
MSLLEEPLVSVSAPPAPSPARQRLRRWTGILSAYFSTQALTQLLGIAAGLVFVNFMPVTEFALYTLATSVLTFFAFLTDLGSSNSLLHFFRRTAAEGTPFAPYYAAVLTLRRAVFLIGVAAVAVVFPLLARQRGFSTGDALLTTAGIVLAVWFQISSSLRLLALRLEDRYGLSYRAELAGAGLRLLLALGMVAITLLEAWLGVLAAATATALTATIARPARRAASAGAELAPYRRQILRYLLPTLPSALYFAVQGPLVVWLAATFGGTRNIAEVGALGRLGLVVGVFSGLVGVVFVPRLARITDDRLYLRRYLEFGSCLAAIAAALLAAAWSVPELLLWLLGPHYSGLHRELLLVVAGASLGLLDGYAVAVNLARSWTRWQGLAVATLAAAQLVLVLNLDLSTTMGVLGFLVWSRVVALAGQVGIAALGFTRPRWVQWA